MLYIAKQHNCKQEMILMLFHIKLIHSLSLHNLSYPTNNILEVNEEK